MDTDDIPDPPYVGGDHAAQCRGCDDCRVEYAEWLVYKAEAENDRLRAVLQDLTRAGEATVTAGHPTGELLMSLVWAQEALRDGR